MEKLRDQVRLLKKPVLTTNYIATEDFDGGSYGGAWFFSKDGELISSLPLGKEGILHIDLKKSL